jgi:hypothetical protein
MGAIGGGARADADGDAGELGIVQLELAGVQPGAQVESELADVGGDRLRAADRARRAVEGCKEAVARSVEFRAVESGELAPRGRMVAHEQIAPARLVEPTTSVKRTVVRTPPGRAPPHGRSGSAPPRAQPRCRPRREGRRRGVGRPSRRGSAPPRRPRRRASVRGEQHPRSGVLLASEKSEGVHGVRYMAEASLVQSSSSFRARVTRGSPTPNRSRMRSSGSSPRSGRVVSGMSSRQSACSRRSSSGTSSARRKKAAELGDAPGGAVLTRPRRGQSAVASGA